MATSVRVELSNSTYTNVVYSITARSRLQIKTRRKDKEITQKSLNGTYNPRTWQQLIVKTFTRVFWILDTRVRSVRRVYCRHFLNEIFTFLIVVFVAGFLLYTSNYSRAPKCNLFIPALKIKVYITNTTKNRGKREKRNLSRVWIFFFFGDLIRTCFYFFTERKLIVFKFASI